MPYPDNVRIVLVEPEFPGNIGASARAMLTMGLSDLVVVAPQCDPRADEAYWMANHARPIVEGLRVMPTLAEALADCVFSVASSSRTRRVRYPIFTPEEVAREVLRRAPDRPVAIVFGRESSGLTNAEVAQCSLQSTIPGASEQLPLNLAQAVQVYCYALLQASLAPHEHAFNWNLATHAEQERFFAHLSETLSRLRTKPASTLENYVVRFRRVIARMPLESRDVNLLHKLLSKIDEAAGGDRDENRAQAPRFSPETPQPDSNL